MSSGQRPAKKMPSFGTSRGEETAWKPRMLHLPLGRRLKEKCRGKSVHTDKRGERGNAKPSGVQEKAGRQG